MKNNGHYPKMGETSNNAAIVGRRDAFHVPGILSYCNLSVRAGDYIKWYELSNPKSSLCQLASKDDYHGIVDPFLKGPIMPGTMFWGLVRPELVSNLTHHFDVGVPVAIKPDPIDDDDDDDDDSCRGCYGYDDDDESDDDEDDSCKGCYE